MALLGTGAALALGRVAMAMAELVEPMAAVEPMAVVRGTVRTDASTPAIWRARGSAPTMRGRRSTRAAASWPVSRRSRASYAPCAARSWSAYSSNGSPRGPSETRLRSARGDSDLDPVAAIVEYDRSGRPEPSAG